MKFDARGVKQSPAKTRQRTAFYPDVAAATKGQPCCASPGPKRFTACGPHTLASEARSGRAGLDDRVRKPLHLLHLRTELKQQQIHSRVLEFPDAIRNLLRRPNPSRAQSAVRDGVILQRP